MPALATGVFCIRRKPDIAFAHATGSTPAGLSRNGTGPVQQSSAPDSFFDFSDISI
jgi:hypothetical protein